MQTYTHAVVGAAIGAIVYPDGAVLQGVCALGAILPDLVMGPALVMDKRAGRMPLAHQSAFLKISKELSHSTMLWGAVVAFGWRWQILWLIAFAGGALSHTLIDMFSHGDPAINRNDTHILWPFRSPHTIGSWDYRYGNALFWPIKLPERMVLGGCIVIVVLSNCLRLVA